MWMIKKTLILANKCSKTTLELNANSLEEAEEFVLNHCGNIKFEECDNGLIAHQDGIYEGVGYDEILSCTYEWTIYQIKSIYEL